MRLSGFSYLLLVLAMLAAGPLLGQEAGTKKTRAKPTANAATPAPKKTTNSSAKATTKKRPNAAGAEAAATASEPSAVSKPRNVEAAKANGSPAGAKIETDTASTPAAAPATKSADAGTPQTPAGANGHAPNASIEPGALVEFAAQPPRVQTVIEAALALTKRQLTYTYGSADPESGGMDCSGTIHHLLRSHGLKDVPRDSAGQYAWLRKAGTFRAVISKSATSFEFDELLPGDLMFWSGTYKVERDIPVTHVMLYLGTEKKTKKRVMFGASDGRTYDGVQRWGVSVFDFKMPRNDAAGVAKTDFLGYARIPGLREIAPLPDLAQAELPLKPAEEQRTPTANVAADENTADTPAPKKPAAKKVPAKKVVSAKRKRTN